MYQSILRRALRRSLERVSRFTPALILSVMCVFTLIPTSLMARSLMHGVGIRLGSLSGLTAQLKLTQASALNAALSYDLLDPSLDISLDQIILTRRPKFKIVYPYFGWGGRLQLRNHKRASGFHAIAHAPLGAEIGRDRWRGFLEFAPGVMVIPQLEVVFSVSLGVRYHFQ